MIYSKTYPWVMLNRYRFSAIKFESVDSKLDEIFPLAATPADYYKMAMRFFSVEKNEPIDTEKHIDFVKQVAERGFPLAQVFLGTYYYHGNGVEKTQKKL